MDDLSLPASPEDLDAGWLTAALGAPGGARVVGVRSEVIGDGKIGSNLRLHLEWSSSEGAPATVVAKLPSPDPSSRATGVSLGLYVRETCFYRELAAGVGARTPLCHAALVDETTGDFVLLLEDLAPAVAGDQLKGCTKAEAEAALDELARLHASTWGEVLPHFVPPAMACTAAEIQPLYCGLVEGFAEKYRSRLSKEVLDVVCRFGDEMVAWGRAADGGPSALLHGDFRLDNLMFSSDRVGVVDWQVVASGPPMADAAYFLGAGLPREERRRHEIGLLRSYHARVLAGQAREEPWPFDDCVEGYRLHSLGGLIMAVVASMMVGDAERSNEMFCTMAERHAWHALDCDAFGLLASVGH